MKNHSLLTNIPFCLAATVLATTPLTQRAAAVTVTFETDFTTGEGVGSILEQGSPTGTYIFAYEENDVFFTAIPFDEPQAKPSHFHLFDGVALPASNTDLLLAADATAFSITLGDRTPAQSFQLNSLDIRAVLAGGDVSFEGFNSQGSTGSTTFNADTNPGLTNLDPGIFGNVNRVDVYFTASGPGGVAPNGAGIIFDNVSIEQVPEPATILGSILVLGLGVFITKCRQSSGKTANL